MIDKDTFCRINYRLYTAIDMISLAIVLDEMVEHGVLNDQERRCFEIQAKGLLGSLRNANQRAAGKGPVSPLM